MTDGYSDYRPHFPDECDHRLQELIAELWSSDPRDRPSAQDAADRIEVHHILLHLIYLLQTAETVV
jgi:hypothetical protein